ncbi:phage tail protein [Modestobacter excelsi]|uniref:phage tail protein n=1 Tax=Modestobacter excelsi TaxID=2213161 RepID=UPI00110CC131|nr:phage tail protein [Modestobacter excelsi]
MTQADPNTTFRLVDPYVGWQPDPTSASTGLTGLADEDGLRLATLSGGLVRDDLLPWFPDPRLAHSSRSGWYLLASGAVPRLLRRDPCTGAWRPLWTPSCDPELLHDPIAVAAAGHRLAVADKRRVLIWDHEGEQLTAVVDDPGARLVAVDATGAVVAAGAEASRLWRYGPDGTPHGSLRTGVAGQLVGLRIGPGGTVWLLSRDGDRGPLRLSTGRPGAAFATTDPAALAEALPASALVAAWAGGFCLRVPGREGETRDECADWSGAALSGGAPRAPRFRTSGTLVTGPLDSGISRCRWHRVRVDAEVPAGCSLSVAVAVTEDRAAEPHERDWQAAPAGVLDHLVDQPPGRWLRLRLTLTSDGERTPVVYRVRLDLPRSTSADLLPAAFRQDPLAEDFTERFLSLFDASLADLDRVIERYPALLDVDGVPDGALTWLGGLLGLGFDAGWGPDIRRRLVAAAPDLYRTRGTPAALSRVIEIVTGMAPDIRELAAERLWATVTAAGTAPGDPAAAGSTLGQARLFGRASARLRLGDAAGVGGSPLGSTPLRARGDPDTDAVSAHAHRFRVTLPPRALSPEEEQTLSRLVARQAPAHTVGTVRSGGLGLVVGVWSAVGVDTALVPLPAPVLGPAPAGARSRPVRLGRSSVLWPGPRGHWTGTPVRSGTAVGVQTLAW